MTKKKVENLNSSFLRHSRVLEGSKIASRTREMSKFAFSNDFVNFSPEREFFSNFRRFLNFLNGSTEKMVIFLNIVYRESHTKAAFLCWEFEYFIFQVFSGSQNRFPFFFNFLGIKIRFLFGIWKCVKFWWLFLRGKGVGGGVEVWPLRKSW